MNNLNRIGIWLDMRNAYLISPDTEDLRIVTSEIEEFNPKGGYGGSRPYEQQDAISEQQFLRRRKQQQKKYFKEISERVKSAEKVIILGPGDTRKLLESFLDEQHDFAGSVIANIAEDSMTKNQLVAAVKEQFKNAETDH